MSSLFYLQWDVLYDADVLNAPRGRCHEGENVIEVQYQAYLSA